MEVFIEDIMGKVMGVSLLANLFGILLVICCVLFMYYDSKRRNCKLSATWYVCGVLFGFWTVIVYLIKRKDFPGDRVKVCYQCGAVYPSNFVMCSNCVIDLPDYNCEIKQKEQKLSRIFAIGLVVTLLLCVATGIVFGVSVAKDILSYVEDSSYGLEEGYRISVHGLYYDKKGLSYVNEENVLLYDEEGNTYKLVRDLSTYDDGTTYERFFYESEDGKRYYEMDCYVTADGWFYCDKAGLLLPYEPDTGSMTEEELDEYYNNYIGSMDEEYRYYDYPYVDGEGNFYYMAFEASWDENGVLITAENDPSLYP